MTVEITQDEMNILNLNGLSVDDVKANIDYMRASGYDDDSIRNQYSDTIKELRPITKTTPNDTENIKKWQKKGGITPFEYAGRKAVEYYGNYDNIDNNANLNKFGKALKNSTLNQKAQERIDKEYNAESEKEKRHEEFLEKMYTPEKLARNKRVNEGTASFLDRLGAFMDRQSIASEKVSYNQDAPDDVVVSMSGVNKPSNIDKSKKINFAESLGNSFMTGSWLPFIGGFAESGDTARANEIRQHILNNEPIRQDELNFINHYLENRNEENVRGYTWGGNVAHDFLPSLIRFGTEIATGGWVLKSLGLGSAAGATGRGAYDALRAAGANKRLQIALGIGINILLK